VVAVALGWLFPPGATADTPRAYLATARLNYEYRREPPMHMPTAVAVAPDGAVFVADGVNDRILQFGRQGEFVQEIRQVGGQRLSRPIGIKSDSRGRLWIADTGNARVLVRAPDGGLERVIVVSSSDRPNEGSTGGEPDITDVAVSPNGKTVWVADNDNHRLGRFELEEQGVGAAGAWTGERGELLGQFQYPFTLAVAPNGDVFVGEVVNARVQVLSGSGKTRRTIGGYGVDLGQLYRPKGIAIDAHGNVWVADSTLGIIQVFTGSGQIIDVLRDAEGAVLRLETPSGLTFDADGNLYVVELSPGRVRKFHIAAGSPVRSDRPGAETPTAEGQARSCTVCHLDRMPPFSQGRGTLLMDVPPSSPEQPIASRADTCLSCHDGSVADSRRSVWTMHAHRTGVTPPETMKIPVDLPLVNGRVACRTCHAAHTGGTPEGDLGRAVSLRVQNAAGKLCLSCHTDKTGGPRLGTHPMGDMPWPVPRALIDAGARVGPDTRELTCQVCHTPHGAPHEHLLVLGTSSSQLCVTCHERIRPGMFGDGPRAEHPLSPKLNARQAAAVRDLGARLGANDELLCLSCHRLHHGKSQRFLLAEELTDARFCLRCHPDRRAMLGTAHDLRQSFPEERNYVDMTPHSGGPCSACHVSHGYARPPEDNELDPGGQCITCHQSGRCAESKRLGPISHPHVKCVVCHDPHDDQPRPFLRKPPADLCVECHEQAEDITGGHEFAEQPDLVNAFGQRVADVGGCLMCHSTHHGAAKPLWGASRTPPATDQEKCGVCHRAGGLAAAKPVKAFNHTLACTKCHNPHGNSDENPALLIVDPPVQNLCLRCHDDHAALLGGPHDCTRNPAAWPQASLDKADRCLACHRPHADENARLFANGLADGVSGPDAACLACHPHAAWGTVSHVAALHPRTATRLDPEDSDLPLVPGEGDDEFLIGCRTCHNPHRGQGPPARLVRAEEDEPTAALCLLCHDGKQYIDLTCHSSVSLGRAGLQADSCKPCHNVHGNPQRVAASLLWGPQTNPDGRLPADQRCRGCHRDGGPAIPPAIASHPNVPMFNFTDAQAPGFLPLFNESGVVDPNGRISCLTCHLPHGRAPNAGGQTEPPAGSLSVQQQRALRLELRRFVAPTLCNTCHGFDGLRRFLYFHDPQRSGPKRADNSAPPLAGSRD